VFKQPRLVSNYNKNEVVLKLQHVTTFPHSRFLLKSAILGGMFGMRICMRLNVMKNCYLFVFDVHHKIKKCIKKL